MATSEDVVVIHRDKLDFLSDEIAKKAGSYPKLTIDEMATEVMYIKRQKPEQEKAVSVTANGTTTVTPDTGKVLSKVTVNANVPSKPPVLQPLSVTENGTYNPPSGVDGYKPVTVNVASGGGVEYVTVTIDMMGQSTNFWFCGENGIEKAHVHDDIVDIRVQKNSIIYDERFNRYGYHFTGGVMLIGPNSPSAFKVVEAGTISYGSGAGN